MKIRQPIAALVLSAVGLIGILSWEGYTDRPVIPVPGDVPTIGFGRTKDVKPHERTTPVRELKLAIEHIKKDEKILKKCIKVPLHQYEYDANISIGYNVGPTKWCKSTAVKKFNAGDYEGGCKEFDRWNKGPQGKPLKGLINRRAWERDLCLGKLEEDK